ncbi:MAG: hypothetical protein IJN99_00785 [Clostridia bacterium]|nr:hypothetical protein [Clostridia bacterium]
MKKSDKMWALYIPLPYSLDDEKKRTREFDQEVWDYVIDEASRIGINTIVLGINNAIEFHSHPEIAAKGAWTQKKLHDELAKCREKNIKVIPMMNFASSHDDWLCQYHRKICTPEYYQVCNDIIKEAYEMFEHPEYIHLAMDEEDAKHVKTQRLAVYRQGELYWHDLRFYVDCVKATGAKPWMWTDPLFDHPEEFIKRFDPDEILLSPWYYNAFNRENWTPISSREVYLTYYNEGEYKNMGIQFVEEDPFLVRVREVAIPLLEKGFRYVPCASVCNKCDCNHSELVEYFKTNATEEQIPGYISAPWGSVTKEDKYRLEDTFRFYKEAMDKHYKE